MFTNEQSPYSNAVSIRFVLYGNKFVWAYLAFLVVGCATSEKYNDEIASWIGKSKTELITAWGPPDMDTSVPPSIGEAKQGCRSAGTAALFEGIRNNSESSVEDATAAVEKCASRMIAEWDTFGSVMYSTNETVSFPSSAPTYRGTITGNTLTLVPFGGSEARTEWRYCHTTFDIERGIIVAANASGNYCRR